jgi:hypothetical protein
MKESQLKKLQLWFHIPALTLGFALAFSGIPYYGNVFLICYIPPPPLIKDYRYITMFAVVPICTAIVILTFNTGVVYWSVRKQMIAARKWSISKALLRSNRTSLAKNANATVDSHILPETSGRGEEPWNSGREMPRSIIQKMERQTFWQAFFYLGAFYLTWPILLVSNLNGYASGYFPVAITVCMLAPLQGFLNFILYARPRIQKYLKQRRRRRILQNSKDTSSSSDNILSMSGFFGRASIRLPKLKSKEGGSEGDHQYPTKDPDHASRFSTSILPKLDSKEGDTEEDRQCLPEDGPDRASRSPLKFDVAAMVDDSP